MPDSALRRGTLERGMLIRRHHGAGPLPSPAPHVAVAQSELIVAGLATALVAVRVQLPLTAPLGLVVALVILPVAVRHVSRYKTVLVFVIVTVMAVVAGILITSATTGPTSTSLMIAQSLYLLGLPATLIVLLWSRTVLGTRRMILMFSLGLLANIVLSGIHESNPWKFSFALPLTLFLLSTRHVYGRRFPQLLTAVALAIVCIVFDSRSAAGFLLIAAALTLFQERRVLKDASDGRVALRWLTFAQIIGVAAGAYYLLQAAILEGMLGDEIRARTQSQIDTSGSILAGGRPEMGASAALIGENPWGYGSGALPSPSQILTAKSGMAQLGYDPDNGYVENYMFGGSFEVHSVLGDLWISFGPLGAVVAILAVVMIVRGMVSAMGAGVLATVATYLAIRSLWDFGFSPFYSSVTLMALAIAALAQPIVTDEVERVTAATKIRATGHRTRRSTP